MKTLRNRIEKIEDILSIGEKIMRLRVRVILSPAGLTEELLKQLGPVEQWAAYKQVEAQYPDKGAIAFMADPQLEIEARKRPLTQDESAGLLVQPQVA